MTEEATAYATQRIHGQSWDDYCAIVRMNASTLVAGCKSMLRLKRGIDGGYPEETNAMRVGTGVHALLLEPALFCQRFCVMPDYHLDAANLTKKGEPSESKATTYYETRRREFEALNDDRTIITETQYESMLVCLNAIQSKPRMASVVNSSAKEVTVFGQIDGVDFKGRIDLLSTSEICDVKSTQNVEKYAFGRVFANLNYAFKLSIYRELVRQHTGRTVAVSVIAQEVAGDYDNAYVPIPDIVLDNAFSQVLFVLRAYKRCLASGVWPGVDEGEEEYELHVPLWSMRDSDELDWSGVNED